MNFLNQFLETQIEVIGKQSKYYNLDILYQIGYFLIVLIGIYVIHKRFKNTDLYIPNLLFGIAALQAGVVGALGMYCDSCHIIFKMEFMPFIIFLIVGFIYILFSIKSQKFLIVNYIIGQSYFLILLLNGVNLIPFKLLRILESLIIIIFIINISINIFLEKTKKY